MTREAIAALMIESRCLIACPSHKSLMAIKAALWAAGIVIPPIGGSDTLITEEEVVVTTEEGEEIVVE